jgi:hypothetical protein
MIQTAISRTIGAWRKVKRVLAAESLRGRTMTDSPEPALCENCLVGGVRRVAFYRKDGCWLCSFCYDLSFDD